MTGDHGKGGDLSQSGGERESPLVLESGREAAALRLRFLTPLVSAIVFIVLVLAVSLFYFESDSQRHGLVQQRLTRTQAVATDLFEQSVQRDASALKAVIDALRRDVKLTALFAAGDREALLDHTAPLFNELRQHYNITHFYFSGADRVNLLRVHAPMRFGDRIDRITTQRAELNGKFSHGVELGVLGTFTLRVVSPWHEEGTRRLVGYLELGMEIDHVVEELRDTFGLDVAVMIHKSFLERSLWEDGMRTLGRSADWDRFPGVVLSAGSSEHLPAVLAKRLARGEPGVRNQVMEIEEDGLAHWLLSIPIEDARGREVAEMVLLEDVSRELNVAERTAIVVGSTVFLLGGLLIVFFSWQAGRVGQYIADNERRLEELATRDSLTGLFTRHMFHQFLDAELKRSNRFDRPLSLLLVDLDHFKKVNDTYGHQAGDAVLREVSARFLKEARQVDRVCRYGGEEFALVAPETDAEAALKFAERLRRLIAALPIEIGEDRPISMTVSVGVASYPQHADTETFLISAVDRALYTAKERGRNRSCLFGD